MSTAPTLRPYQTACLEAIAKAREAGQNRLLVKKPTGTGKTLAFAALLRQPAIREWLDTFPATERKMLVIAHREELLDQAAEKIRAANPGVQVSIEQGERHANRWSDVVIASIQSLAARKFTRLQRLLRQQHVFRLVIVDEAHHCGAPTYRTALVHLGFLPPADASDEENIEAASFDDVAVMTKALEAWDTQAPQDRLLVGFTATPNRSDAIGLGCVFQTIVYSYNLRDAISDGWLVPITPWVVETQESLDDVRVHHGEFNQKDLAEAVNKSRRNLLAVAAWQEHGQGRPTLAFTVDVTHAHALAETFRDAKTRALALSGETPKDDRRLTLRQFLDGQIDVITNCQVLTEGTDLPLTSCIVHAKPTKSATAYEQMCGRGLRIWPTKSNCVVIDLVDVARRHSLQAAPVLYGLPPGLKTEGQPLQEIADTFERIQEQYPQFDLEAAMQQYGRLTLAQLQATATTFDVWTVPDLGEVGAGLTMNWIKVGLDRYRLQYPWQDGTEILRVEPDLVGHFDISCTLRPRESGSVRQRTLAAGIVSAQAALALAEGFVHNDRRQVLRLKDRDAAWRTVPASDKQISLLQRLRVPIPRNLTKGHASDLIDLAQARRAR